MGLSTPTIGLKNSCCQFYFGFYLLVFFINVWERSKKVVKRCKTMLRNFEWQRQRARVNWTDCCACKAVGVLSLIDLEDDLLDLLCKWIFMPLELGDSNLMILLRFKLAQSKPSWHNRWTLDLNWAMVKGQVSTPGSNF